MAGGDSYINSTRPVMALKKLLSTSTLTAEPSQRHNYNATTLKEVQFATAFLARVLSGEVLLLLVRGNNDGTIDWKCDKIKG